MRDDLKALGKRIRDARRDANLTQEEIGRQLGASKQLISHWETGRSEITVFDLAKVAKMCGVSPDYLLTGVVRATSNKALPTGVDQIIGFASRDDCFAIARGDIDPSDLKEKHACHVEVSARAFRTVIPERAMEPLFAADAQITVDPNVTPHPGDLILVALNGSDELLFRRYQPSSGGRRGVEPPYVLKSDNSFYEPRQVTKSDKPVWLGTLVERLIFGAR